MSDPVDTTTKAAERLNILDHLADQIRAKLPGERFVIVAAPTSDDGVHGAYVTNCETFVEVHDMLRSVVDNLERAHANQ
jgi:hypothetical protein